MIRRCDHCGKPMREGYVIENGLEYYCCDECLNKYYTAEEWKLMYNDDGDNYWTEWEDEECKGIEFEILKWRIIKFIKGEKHASGYWYQFLLPRRLTSKPIRLYRWLNFYHSFKDEEE